MKDWLHQGLLFTFFDRLRRRGLELDLRQYELLLRSLRAGVGSDREGGYTETGFRQLCETLWLTHRRSRDMFRQTFNDTFRELERTWKTTAEPGRKDLPEHGPDTSPTEHRQPSKPNISKDPPPSRPPRPPETPPTDPKTTDRDNFREWEVSFESDRSTGPGEPAPVPSDTLHPFLYKDLYLPFSPRRLQHQCRYLRYRAEQRPSRALDLAATVRATTRTGGFPRLRYTGERYYLESFVVFVDRGESMAAFDKTADAFVRALQEGLGLREQRSFRVYYFDAAPRTWLYTDPKLSISRHRDAIDGRISEDDYVFIISDAGAAARREDPERQESIVKWIQHLREKTAHLLWLNPLPAVRWAGTPAIYIPLLTNCLSISAEDMPRLPGVLRHL